MDSRELMRSNIESPTRYFCIVSQASCCILFGMVVVIPPELEPKLRQAAAKKGMPPEEFALERVREGLPETLFDAWQDFIGVVQGNGEANSEQTGAKFAQAMLEKKATGHF
jgi:hypothetical protein